MGSRKTSDHDGDRLRRQDLSTSVGGVLLETLLRHASEAIHQGTRPVRAKAERIAWALVEDEEFIGDEDGPMVFETRTVARKYQRMWAAFYKRLESNRKPPMVVKVSVRVEEIKTVEVVDDSA